MRTLGNARTHIPYRLPPTAYRTICIVIPPSTVMISPVMNSLVTSKRTASATSSTAPISMQRDSLGQVMLLLLVGHRLVESRADDARSDAVDADVVVGNVPGEHPRKLEDRAFDRTVGDRSGTSANARGRRDEDNHAFVVFPHLGQRAFAEMEGGFDVNGERLAPLFCRNVVDPPARRPSRAMHKDVEPAECLHRLVNRPHSFRFVGHVAKDQRTFSPECYDVGDDLACGLVVVSAVDGNISAPPRQDRGQSPPRCRGVPPVISARLPESFMEYLPWKFQSLDGILAPRRPSSVGT